MSFTEFIFYEEILIQTRGGLYRYVWLRGGTFIIYIYSLIFFQILKIYLTDELLMVIIHLSTKRYTKGKEQF